MVDSWFEPSNKDDPEGWRGRGEVVAILPHEGKLAAQLQGRTLTRRKQEVRPHIAFLVGIFLASYSRSWFDVRRVIEGFKTGACMILGLVWRQSERFEGVWQWLLSKDTTKEENHHLFEACLDAAAQEVALICIIAVRIGKAIRRLPALEHYTKAQLWMWTNTQHPQGDPSDSSPSLFEPNGYDLWCSRPLKHLAD